MISPSDTIVVRQIVLIDATYLLSRIPLLILTLCCLLSLVHDAGSSVGDNLFYYRKCLSDCQTVNCSTTQKITAFREQQDVFDYLTGWTCFDECQYGCQWETINYLSLDEVSGSRFHQYVPQFYGKWTFRRFLGVQEPASALFSIFNLSATLIAWRKFRTAVRSVVRHSEFYTDPLLLITDASAILAINAWFWSTVFHVHDYPLTEKLDYFSASSVVLVNLYSIVIRLLEDFILGHDESGSITQSPTTSWKTVLLPHPHNRNFLFLAIGVAFAAFYWHHVSYMAFKYFDYGYNMKVNIAMGVTGSGLWLLWAFMRIQREKDPGSVGHVKTGIFTVIFLNLCLSLEIADFPPILYSSLDSHALWHLATSPIPFFWFRFLAQETISSRCKKLLMRQDRACK